MVLAPWLKLAIFSASIYGFGLFFSKLASINGTSATALQLSYVVAGLMTSMVVSNTTIVGKVPVEFGNWLGILCMILCAACSSSGYLSMNMALKLAKITEVSPIVGMSPIIACLLGILVLSDKYAKLPAFGGLAFIAIGMYMFMHARILSPP